MAQEPDQRTKHTGEYWQHLLELQEQLHALERNVSGIGTGEKDYDPGALRNAAEYAGIAEENNLGILYGLPAEQHTE